MKMQISKIFNLKVEKHIFQEKLIYNLFLIL